MLFQGKAIKCNLDSDHVAILTFDRDESDINKFDKITLEELNSCIDIVSENKTIKGLIMNSTKNEFIVGADVTEFLTHFKRTDRELEFWLLEVHKLFNRIEDFSFPTVSAINGIALGGGFEICLTTTFRLASVGTKIGLPETQLGIIPGWGGTVRLSRITGADNAIEWITSGKHYNVEDGMKIKVIDGITSQDDLLSNAKSLIERCHQNRIEWRSRRAHKMSTIPLNKMEAMMAFETAKGFVAGIAGPNYPAPVTSIETMQAGAKLERDDAQKLEVKAFVKLAKLKSTESLVKVFLGGQYLKKVSKQFTGGSTHVKKAAVLGAGIMGGGIAYQSASKKIPIIMKDINEEALAVGMNEASKLLEKQVTRKKIDFKKAATALSNITPALSYGEFDHVNLVVEAVVENEKIKKQVLADLEKAVTKDTVLTSNTSTISIDKLAEGLTRPENFCGMHFFNPVFKMPLVEIIKGNKSSKKTIASTVQYALDMGKTPIVVNDCPGFLVNRILFPYLGGFNKLMLDKVDFVRVDKIMEKFGWPMGPAYLLDVVGIDTAFHAATIMASEFSRMKEDGESSVQIMFDNKRYGQKNGVGFYSYAPDKKGRLKKSKDDTTFTLLNNIGTKKEVTDKEIIERMMLPMIFESVRCLEDKIVQSHIEVDMGLLLGIGFPPFRTGALKYADDLGLSNICELAKKYEYLGELYKAPELLISMAAKGKTFYN